MFGRTMHSWKQLLPLLVVMTLCFGVFLSGDASAQTDPYTCNDKLKLTYSKGILAPIITEIQGIVDDASQKLYEGIVKSANFPGIVRAAMTLYIAIFGLMFTAGMVQLTAAEAFKRVFRIVLLGMVLTGGWGFFEKYGYRLFREGSDEIIGYMTQIMVSNVGLPGSYVVTSLSPTGGPPSPFEPIDQFLQDFFTPETFTIFQASSGAGPYGLIFILVFGAAIFLMMAGIARALWVYLVALIAIALMLGLAPIFIGFFLFDRTKHLFDGWLSILVNFALQPILMFTFLGFFVTLMSQAMESILAIKVCYAPKSDVLSGSPYEVMFWQFTDDNGNPLSVRYGADGPICGDNPCPKPSDWATEEFPLDIVDALTFFLLAYVSWNFFSFVTRIANDLSGSFLNIDEGSPVTQGMSQMGGAVNRGIGAAVSGGDPMQAMFNSKGGAQEQRNVTDRSLATHITGGR